MKLPQLVDMVKTKTQKTGAGGVETFYGNASGPKIGTALVGFACTKAPPASQTDVTVAIKTICGVGRQPVVTNLWWPPEHAMRYAIKQYATVAAATAARKAAMSYLWTSDFEFADTAGTFLTSA